MNVRPGVSNALPAVKERADLVLTRDHGRGVNELIYHILDNDLSRVNLSRHYILLGTRDSGEDLRMPAFGGGLLKRALRVEGRALL